MSISAKINKPAWPGASRPEGTEFSFPVPEKLTGYIYNLIKRHYIRDLGVVTGCKSLGKADMSDPSGHFRIDAEEGGRRRPLFARIGLPWHPAKGRIISAVTRHLSDNGINCQRWLRRADSKSELLVDIKTFPSHVQFSLAEFEEMRLIGTLSHELAILGREIGRMHKALRRAPFSGEIRQRSRRRAMMLSRTMRMIQKSVAGPSKDHFGERSGWVRKNAGFIARLAGDYRPDFRIYTAMRCQAVHGDLNAGNVLGLKRGGIIFLDLEEADHSYLPPLADLAMVIERFIIHDRPDGRVLRARLKYLFSGYVPEAGNPFSGRGGDEGRQIAAMIRQLDYHAVCVLLSMGSKERKGFPDEEWDKFVSLESKVAGLEHLLAGAVSI